MSTINSPLSQLGPKFHQLRLHLVGGEIPEDLLQCWFHAHPPNYFCSSACQNRLIVQQLFREILGIYEVETAQIQCRWSTVDKSNIDDDAIICEKTLREQRVGKKSSKDVQDSLKELEEKLSPFFWLIYPVLSSMSEHEDDFRAVENQIPGISRRFFELSKLLYGTMQDFLYRSVCVTNIDSVMTLKLRFNLILSLLLPTDMKITAKAAPFLVKTCPKYSSVLEVSMQTNSHIFDYGQINEDFESSYLKSAAESYDLRIPGEVAGSESTVTDLKGPKRKKPDSGRTGIPDETNLLKRNIREFMPTASSFFQADFSRIRLMGISKDEKGQRRIVANSHGETSSSGKATKAAGVKSTRGMAEKLRRMSGGKTPQSQSAELQNHWQNVGEIVYNIVLAVEISFLNYSFYFYKKIKVPVAVASSQAQWCHCFASIIWNSIVWLEEFKGGKYQWDHFPPPETIDRTYKVPHDHFVNEFLSPLMNVLTRVKHIPQKQKITSTSRDSESTENQSDEELLDDLLPILSDELCDELFEDLHISDGCIGGQNPFSTKPNLNNKHLGYLSKKLSSHQSNKIQRGFVTRDSFLGSLKTPTTSFFFWFFFTCQAIGKNFGIKTKSSDWFGDPSKSVWHSNFVVGYIDSTEADAILRNMRKRSSHLLLLRFSETEKHSLVVHMVAGNEGPLQKAPASVGNTESLEDILKNSLFTLNYQLVVYNNDGDLITVPKKSFHDWVQKTINESPPPGVNVVPRYAGYSSEQIRVLEKESYLHHLMTHFNIQPDDAKNFLQTLENLISQRETPEAYRESVSTADYSQSLMESPVMKLLKCIEMNTLTSKLIQADDHSPTEPMETVASALSFILSSRHHLNLIN